MRSPVLLSSALLVSAMLPLSSISTSTVLAAQSSAKNAQPQSSAPKPNGNVTASASQDAGAGKGGKKNPLEMCMSKIPADSSKGQRLLAEQGCRQEQQVRTSRHAAPEF